MEKDRPRLAERWVPAKLTRFVLALLALSVLVALVVYLQAGSLGWALIAFVTSAIAMQVAYFATVVLYVQLIKREREPAKINSDALRDGAPKQP